MGKNLSGSKEDFQAELKELSEKYKALKKEHEKYITDSKLAEKELVLSESKLQALINNKDESVWSLDRDYNLIVCNDYFRDAYLAAYGMELKVGLNLVKILTPKLRAFWKPKYDKALSGERISFEFSEKIQDIQFHFSIYLNPILADGKVVGVTASSVDISDRKRYEKALQESEEKYRKAFQTSPDAVNINKLNGLFVDINQGFTQLTGYTREDVIGKLSSEIEIWAIPEDRKKLISGLNKNGYVANLESKFRRKDGSVTTALMSASVISLHNEPHILSITRDISKRKDAEEEIRMNESRLKSLVEILQYEPEKIEDFLDYALDQALKLTESKIGYIYHYSEKKKEFTLNSWSKDVMKECSIQDQQTVYQLDKTGIWGEAVRQRKPIVLNDFQATNPLKKGYPKGHAHLERFLTIPVNFNGEIVGVIGLGNKETDYNESDLLQVSLLADSVWKVVDRRKAEHELRESEERYRKFLENNEAIIITVNPENGNILFANDAAVNFYGWKREELLTMNVNQINTLAPEEIKEKMAEARKTQKNYFNFKHRLANGAIRDVEVYQSKLYLKNEEIFSLIIHDLTERKKAEGQLKLLGRAIEQNPVTIIITDRDGKIEYVNPKFTEITGYSFNEAIGENPKLLQSGEHTDEFYKVLWDTILSGNDWHGEFQNRKKNGDHYWESAVISPVTDEKGEISFFVAVKEDITEKRKMLTDLISAKEKAEESDRLKSAFLANMSHEIRTPMNGILGFAELLREPGVSLDTQLDYIDIIEKSGFRMLNIINDLIDISKIEAGLEEVEIRETNINSQLEEIETFFKPEVEAKNIKLIITKGLSSNESNIFSDTEKVYAILSNLVKNAIKFTDKGSIEVGYSRKDDYIEFFVKDTGIGISRDLQNMIFERFRQGNESLSRLNEGTGLGLSICRSYVNMLNGKLWVESKSGNGSTFYFTLPYKKYSNEPVRSSDKALINKSVPLSDLQILVVEDDEASTFFLSTLLGKYNYKITNVANGSEAVKFCRNRKDIDLVLMDIRLPGISGYEATRQIREFNKELVIIAQTAYAALSDREKALAAGCNEYISKPININKLLEIIRKHLK